MEMSLIPDQNSKEENQKNTIEKSVKELLSSRRLMQPPQNSMPDLLSHLHEEEDELMSSPEV